LTTRTCCRYAAPVSTSFDPSAFQKLLAIESPQWVTRGCVPVVVLDRHATLAATGRRHRTGDPGDGANGPQPPGITCRRPTGRA
jgi:hypothetical protein